MDELRIDVDRYDLAVMQSYQARYYDGSGSHARDQDVYRNHSFLYDNALGIIALLASDDAQAHAAARRLGDSILSTVLSDGSYYQKRSSGHVLPTSLAPRPPLDSARPLGDNAWFGLALIDLYEKTDDATYLDAAKKISNWADGALRDPNPWGGYRGGYDASGNAFTWRSTEHNIDMFALNRRLAVAVDAISGTAAGDVYRARASFAGNFVLRMYDATPGSEKFWTGSTPNADVANTSSVPLDVQIWAALALSSAPELLDSQIAAVDWSKPITWAEGHLRTSDTSWSGQTFTGFTFGSAATGGSVWTEGTAQAATLYGVRGNTAAYASAMNELTNVQQNHPFGDARGIVAATSDGLTDAPLSGGPYDARLHVGATAWLSFAQKSLNPFDALPNVPPSLDVNLGLSLQAGATASLSPALLKAVDPDDPASKLQFTLTSLPLHGALKKSGTTLGIGGGFTQADIDAGFIAYTHDGSETTADAFLFTVSDGSGGTTSPNTFAIAVAPANHPPVFADRTLYLYSKAKNGTLAGTLQASAADAGQTVQYSLVGGNNGAFQLHAQTGELRVLDRTKLIGNEIILTVRATDDGSPPKSTDAQFTVKFVAANTPPTFTLTDSSSNPVTLVRNRATLTLDENSPTGTLVGTVRVDDLEEAGVIHSATMVDPSGALTFNAADGRITVADPTKLNFERLRQFTATFKTVDHGIPGLPTPRSSTLIVTVKLNDLNERPTITSAAEFTVRENTTRVGTVTARDPDRTGPNNSMTFSIVSQRDAAQTPVADVFAIDARGRITAARLDFETSPTYTLVVRVTDGGTPSLFTEQTLTVRLTNVNESASARNLNIADAVRFGRRKGPAEVD